MVEDRSLSLFRVRFEGLVPAVSVDEAIGIIETLESQFGVRFVHLGVGNVDVYDLKNMDLKRSGLKEYE